MTTSAFYKLKTFFGQRSVWTTEKSDFFPFFGEETVVESSEVQREVFAKSLIDSDASRAYNQSISIFLEGKLDLDAIYASLLNLIDRHEALRGVFSPDGMSFRIRTEIPFEMPILENVDYENFIREEMLQPFDLVRGPLFRSTLIRLTSRCSVLVFSCHHSTVDGWSLKALLHELPKIYTALMKHQENSGLEPAFSFLEYLNETVLREKMISGEMKRFWKKLFPDGVPPLDLPIDKPRPAQRTFRSRRIDHKIDRRIFDRLKQLNVKNDGSQFVTLLSIFSLYLHRITGQRDHVIGVPCAGQIKSGKANLVGNDARILPIRCSLEVEDTFLNFSARIKEQFFSAYENQWVSLTNLIQELHVMHDPARAPLIAVTFSLDPGMTADPFKFHELSSRHFYNYRAFEEFEISINAVVGNEDLLLECAYNSDLFDDHAMKDRLAQLETLMASIVESPNLLVGELPILTSAQVSLMHLELNSTEMKFDRSLCVDQMVKRMVDAHPKRVAVEFGEKRLSYEEVWAMSGKIAQTIIENVGQNSNGPQPLIGVMFDRSEILIPTLLGIWRAGGAFVPLDPRFPLNRLQFMATHSGLSLILTQPSYTSLLEIENGRYLNVAESFARQDAYFVDVSRRNSDELAYVIFTSGSTGTPKGVKIPHRALGNFLTAMATKGHGPGISADARVLSLTTISFDIAELELWLPLIVGARTVIVDQETSLDGHSLMKVVRDRKINFIQATPAAWRILIYSGWAGDPGITALCGGEELPRELAGEIIKHVGILWNVYGPTETTVWSTFDHVEKGCPITIGKPIGNTQTYILDGYHNPVPRGVVGELWLGGEGVADGYLGRDDLTQERFCPNPFTGRGRMYKTGDLVRLRQDGRIEYVGRNDFQVKIRGYRIELGEVQFALAQHPAIQQCVVVIQDKTSAESQIVAYYSINPGKSVESPELIAAMRERLPEYMIPSYFMELGMIPLTANGKVNVKDLPAVSGKVQTPHSSDDSLPPRSEAEIYLAHLWSELLGGKHVGRNDRFYTLGGYPLAAVRAVCRVEEERQIRVNLRVMATQRLKEIARFIGNSAASSTTTDLAGEPLFFGHPEFKKFGCFYPGDADSDFGILICPPLGQEYMRTHWLIRNISIALNKQGIPVFRFDYYGQGDSKGNPGNIRLNHLIDSVLEAVEELRIRSSVQKIKLIAIRASALVVSCIQERLGKDVQIILADPANSGTEYLNMLRTVQKKYWHESMYQRSQKILIKNAQNEEILGQLYSREFIRELEATTTRLLSSAINLSITPSAGWDDALKFDNIFLSPNLIRNLQLAVFGDSL